MTTAVLFGGQGEQRVAMLHELPAVGRSVLDEAAGVLGYDPRTIDDESGLETTSATQLALLLAGVAWWRAIVEAGVHADYLAGHSVGLWAAAVAADAIDLADAVALVRLRGTRMAEASPAGAGMLAVIGLDERSVDRVMARVRGEGFGAWSSNVNAPRQITVSGTGAGLDRAAEMLEHAGAQRIVRLHVAAPAHSPLMEPAADSVRAAMVGVDLRRPRLPILGNVSGQTLFTADGLRDDLWQSISRPVRWATGTQILAERGVDRWLQLAPGHTFAHLAAGLPDARAWALDDVGVAGAADRLR